MGSPPSRTALPRHRKLWTALLIAFAVLAAAHVISHCRQGPGAVQISVDAVVALAVSGLLALVLWMEIQARRSNRLLEESQQRNRLLLASLPQCVFFKDADGVFVSVNERFAEEFDLSPEEIVGKTDFDLFPRDMAKQYRRDDMRVMESGQPETKVEDHLVGGERLKVEVAKAPVVDSNGETIGVLGLYVDVTERESEKEALHESEKRFRELFDEAPVGYHEIDTEGRIVRVNRTELDMLGYEQQEMLGRPVWEFVEKEEAARRAVKAKLGGDASPGPPFERTYLCKDGGTMPVRVKDRVLWRNGAITGIRTTIENISDLREAEKALQVSEARFRSFINSTSDFAFIKDRNFRHLFANRAFLEFLGMDWEQVEGKTDFELLPQGLAETARATDHEVVESGEVAAHEMKDGERIFDGRKFPVPLGEDEVGIGGLVREITERRKAEEELRESREKLRSIVENIGIGIALISPRMEILELNRQMREWFPEAQSGPGCQCKDHLIGADRDRPCPDCPAARTLADGGVHESTLEFEHNGEESTFRLVSSPVWGAADTIEGAIVMAEDITKALALEEQLHHAARMEALGQLAGGVAHDFNNLLTGMIGYAQLLREETEDDSDLDRDLAEIERLGERGAALTGQLLSFSRQRLMRPVVLDLNEQVAEMLNMLQRVIGEDVELEFRPARDLCNVRADAAQMQEVLMNLAVNARDAMPEGGDLLIETENVLVDEDFADRHLDLEQGQYVRLSVTDTGCGMDEKTLEHVFEPFFTTKEQGRGTGLGLATVHGTVSQHDGVISVYSQPGEGTTFKIYLPSAEQDLPDAETGPARHDMPRGSETVLLVEDEDAVRLLALRILEKQGYTVLPAADPAEAREIFRENADRIDLLLTDIIMPGENGDQLYQALSAEMPSLRAVYMSGYASQTVVQRGVEDLDTSFIMKPFDARELCTHVRMALDAEPEEES